MGCIRWLPLAGVLLIFIGYRLYLGGAESIGVIIGIVGLFLLTPTIIIALAKE